MGKIFCLLGKSSAGKDTIYKELLAEKSLALSPLIPYTTRPIRAGEREGVEYHFTDEAGYKELCLAGKVLESRVYATVHGPWRYFTVDDGQIDLAGGNYLAAAGTLPAYRGIREHYGAESVFPILIDVEDGVRLQRALDRERRQELPRYEELCRRFLADSADFAEEKIREAGVTRIFRNEDLRECLAEIIAYIRTEEDPCGWRAG